MCQNCVACYICCTSPRSSEPGGCGGPASDTDVRQKPDEHMWLGEPPNIQQRGHHRCRPNTNPLSDEQWERLHGLSVLPPHTPGRHEVDSRLIVEGILWLMRTGSPWRSLSARFGAWFKILYYYRQWK